MKILSKYDDPVTKILSNCDVIS